MFSLCESPFHTWENSFTMTLKRSESAIRRPNRMWLINCAVSLNIYVMWRPGERTSPLNKLRNTSGPVVQPRKCASNSVVTMTDRTSSMTDRILLMIATILLMTKTILPMAETTLLTIKRTLSMIKTIVSMVERTLFVTERTLLMTSSRL